MVQRVLNQKKHRALQGWLEFTAETDLIHARWKSKSNYELQLLRDRSVCHWLDLQNSRIRVKKTGTMPLDDRWIRCKTGLAGARTHTQTHMCARESKIHAYTMAPTPRGAAILKSITKSQMNKNEEERNFGIQQNITSLTAKNVTGFRQIG